MSDYITIKPTDKIPSGPAAQLKPSYLIKFRGEDKKKIIKFITLDKPEPIFSFLVVKGIESELSDDEIKKNFLTLLTNIDRNLILELWIPSTEIARVQSLTFKAK